MFYKVIDVPSFLSYLCSLQAESLLHLIGDHEIVVRTWTVLFRWLELDFPMHVTVSDMVVWVDSLHLCLIKKGVIIAIVIKDCWMLWHFRRNDNW